MGLKSKGIKLIQKSHKSSPIPLQILDEGGLLGSVGSQVSGWLLARASGLVFCSIAFVENSWTLLSRPGGGLRLLLFHLHYRFHPLRLPCRWLSWLIWTNNPLLPPLQGQVQVQPLQTYTTNSERNANLVATRELFQSLIIKLDPASAKSMVCPREKVKCNPQ